MTPKKSKEFSDKWDRATLQKKKRPRQPGQTMSLHRQVSEGFHHFWANRMRAECVRMNTDSPIRLRP